MAKSTKIFKMQHNDSFEVWEGSEEEWEQMQPRIKAKYQKVSERNAPATPPEAQQNN